MKVFLSTLLSLGSLALVNSQLCARLGRHLLETTCVLTPEGGEGPYYLAYPNLIRKDIREDRSGLPLTLKFTLTDVTKCEPIKNASIDIWQADPFGFYSSYTKNSPDAVEKPKRATRATPSKEELDLGVPHAPATDNSTFLRGVQFTDDEGKAEFTTIFPGWYAFRTPHIHVMAHVDGKIVHVSQLYFNNNMINRIKRLSPYKQRAKVAVKNEDDYIFKRDSGHLTMIHNIKPTDGRRMSRGLTGEIVIGMNPNKESTKALHH